MTNDEAANDFFVQFQRGDAIVNAAEIIDHNCELELEGFSQAMDVNLTAALRITNAALPGLKAARGAVVYFASIWAFSAHAPRCRRVLCPQRTPIVVTYPLAHSPTPLDSATERS
ncbi:SDR family oxidoreductase [Pseudomonas azerbaijanoccidentalis]|uniref:SDR family oxidoreductase n=1 Tax=Pseudomonas azerbaijanoccidentalis TaxID=2842347 RepID=UPI003462ACD6